MSSNTIPYIGAKISLISRADIRYEGILADVDPSESTISLEQVRIMGTEGRRPIDQPQIPANPNVYEYVIFRSTDIKDLQVFEAPQDPPAQQNPFNDPAVVMVPKPQAHQQSAPSYGEATATAAAPGWPSSSRLQFGSATTVTSFQPQGYQQPPTNSLPQPSLSMAPGLVPIGKLTGVVTSTTIGKTTEEFPSRPQHQSHQRSTAPQTESGGKKLTMAYSTGTGKTELVSKPPESSNRSYASVLHEDGPSNGRDQTRYRRGGGRPGVPQPSSFNPPAINAVEFDFVQANSKLPREPEDLIQLDPSTIYYEKSSFFDNISCETATARKIADDRNERQWNMETFGVASSGINHHYHNHQNHRGGYGYRRGSRGGGRGRGGYYRGGRGHHQSDNS